MSTMQITTMPYINTIDNAGNPLMRPALPTEDPDGTWFVFTDYIDGPGSEEFGVMVSWTEVVDSVPLQVLSTVESMMETYRRDHAGNS